MEKYFVPFFNYLVNERNRSRNTVAAYRYDLQQFVSWLKNLPTSSTRVPTKLVDRYVSVLHSKSNSPATLARKLASLRSFIGYLVAERVLEPAALERIPTYNVKRQPPITIETSEVTRLIDGVFADESSIGKRNLVILLLICNSGLRISEITDLDITDFDRDTGMLNIATDPRKTRAIRLRPETELALTAYLGHARPKFLGHKRESALFLSKIGKRLSRQTFWLELKQYVQTIGLEANLISARTLRNSFARQLLKSGENLQVVRELLGHINVATTKVHLGSKVQVPSY